MVLSTAEKLASRNPTVRREGQAELSSQTPHEAKRTISKAQDVTRHAGTISYIEVSKETAGVKRTADTLARRFPEQKQQVQTAEIIQPTMATQERTSTDPRTFATRERVSSVDQEPEQEEKKGYLERADIYVSKKLKWLPSKVPQVRPPLKPISEQNVFIGTRAEKYTAPVLKYSSVISKGVKKFVVEKPVTTTGIGVASVTAGAVLGTAAAVSGTVRLGLSAAEPILTSAYVGTKAIQVKKAPTIEARGEVIGGALVESTAFVGGLKFGGSIARSTIVPKVESVKATYTLRSQYLKHSGKSKLGVFREIPLEVQRPTYQYQQVKGEFAFGTKGEIVGRQTKLADQPVSRSTATSPQAEFTQPKLSAERIPQKSSPEITGEYLGKYLPRPLSPKVTAKVRSQEIIPQTTKTKFQSEFMRTPTSEKISVGKSVVSEVTPTGTKRIKEYGTLSVKGELVDPEVKFPTKPKKPRSEFIFGKRGQITLEKPELVTDKSFDQFSGEYYIKRPQPSLKPTQQFKVDTKLSLYQRDYITPVFKSKIEPISKSSVKTIVTPDIAQVPVITTKQTPAVVQEPSYIQRSRQRQRQEQVPDLKIKQVLEEPTRRIPPPSFVRTPPKRVPERTPPIKTAPPPFFNLRQTKRVQQPSFKFPAFKQPTRYTPTLHAVAGDIPRVKFPKTKKKPKFSFSGLEQRGI